MAETREGGVYKVGRGKEAKYVDANGKEVDAPTKAEEQASASEPASGGGEAKKEIPYADLLAAEGYKTPEQIRAASDEDLLEVDGIGPARLAEIRAATKE
jgi:predicted flap endonuclease-1-like 5' DNA nuclease